MSQAKPTDIEVDDYAKEYIKHADQSRSWRAAFPNSNAAPETIHVKASKFHKMDKVQVRLGKVRAEASKIASDKFTITVEQRLKWLNEIVDAGLEDIKMADGTYKRQNLPAAKSAIDTLNTMLGVDEDNGTVKPVKVFVGVQDAS
jgi:hypothetical protein